MLSIPRNQVATDNPQIAAYLKRLRTIKQYADEEGISVTQVYRRIKEGKAETEDVGDKVFIVLPATKE
jgi:DNA invertase Pin-like site-specific DNA recombinase